jgi:hypothetical protein
MKAVALFLVCVLMAACYCNHNQELVNNIKNMQHAGPNVNLLANNCEFQRYFWTYNTNRNSLNAIGDQIQLITWLKAIHGRQFFKALKDLKFGRRAMSLSFENYITGSRSGVIAKALIGYRNGDTVVASVGVATSTCDMIHQYDVRTYQKCTKILLLKKCENVSERIPRGFHPNELNNVLSKLQSDATRELYNSVSSHTGLKADNLDNSLETLYITESQVLRKFYPEITYDYTDLSDVPPNDMISAVKEASQGQIGDVNILNRIKQVAISVARSSFFFAPNNNLLFVISINKVGANYLIRISSFTVSGRLPGGAFATSVGGWNLERAGNAANPSVNEILKIFPALK